MAGRSRDNPKQKLKQLLHSQSRRVRAEATSGQAGHNLHALQEPSQLHLHSPRLLRTELGERKKPLLHQVRLSAQGANPKFHPDPSGESLFPFPAK